MDRVKTNPLCLNQSLTDNQLNWHTCNNDAYSLIFALRKFWPYLLGRCFTWHTDHMGLQWLWNARDHRGHSARWLEESEEFDFVILHRPGARLNPHAEALSRAPTAHSLFCDGHLSLQEFQTRHQSDPVLCWSHGCCENHQFNSLCIEYFWSCMINDHREYTVSHISLLLAVIQPLLGLLHPLQLHNNLERKPTKNGNHSVLVVVDLLTRAAEIISIPDKSAKTVASALKRDVWQSSSYFDNLTINLKRIWQSSSKHDCPRTRHWQEEYRGSTSPS